MSVIHYTAARAREGLQPVDLGLEFIAVRRLEVSQDSPQQVLTNGNEVCLVLLSGRIDYECTLSEGDTKADGADVMDMILVPPGSQTHLRLPADGADGSATVMTYESPSERGADFYHIRFSTVDASPATHHVYGKAETGCQRDVWNFIDSQHNCSRLMMGMCEGRAGGWTAWPPHEHTAEREEVYVYFDMGKSFGIQCVYESLADSQAVTVVREGDVVSIPGGYHPNTGSPGGRIKYVYCMAAKTPGARDFMDLRIQPEFGDTFE